MTVSAANPVLPVLQWTEDGQPRCATWRSEAGHPPPAQVILADDSLPADRAWRLASEGTALLWQGDFNNARHLLQAMARRASRPPRRHDTRKHAATPPAPAPAEAFQRHRNAQQQRARALSMLLIPFEADHRIALRRAPDVAPACTQARGEAAEPYVASLRELLGLIGAYEWRKKGVAVPALGDRIHPHYGVFSPVRGEYIDLITQAPLPRGATELAFDIGTGTGVLAAVLARRGVAGVVATDSDPRALACAEENLIRLGMAGRVTLQAADLFPLGRAPLVLCNPPWLPALPTSPLEHAIYDPDSRMLRGFLAGLAAHLTSDGEGWLILSDLAEHLELRSREQLLGWIADAGLRVIGRIDIRPRHHKAQDAADPLHAARSREVTSLWRLVAPQ